MTDNRWQTLISTCMNTILNNALVKSRIATLPVGLRSQLEFEGVDRSPKQNHTCVCTALWRRKRQKK